MKKRSLKLFAMCLLLTTVMVNCIKDHTEPQDPDEPDTELVDKINGVKLDPFTATPPAATTVEAAKVEPSAATAALNGGLDNLGSGPVPQGLTDAGAAVSAAFNPTELAALNAISPADIAGVAAGGSLSPALQALLTKALSDPALAAYFPTFTPAKVNGVTVNGRIGTIETSASVEGVLVTDACIDAANAAFDGVKATLDAAKSTRLATIATTYSNAIAPVAGDLTSCNTTAQTTATTEQTTAQNLYNSTQAKLDAAQTKLGTLYDVFSGLNSLILLGTSAEIIVAKAAAVKACTAISDSKTEAAKAARDADILTVNANYDAKILEATNIKKDLILSCHNQGTGG